MGGEGDRSSRASREKEKKRSACRALFKSSGGKSGFEGRSKKETTVMSTCLLGPPAHVWSFEVEPFEDGLFEEGGTAGEDERIIVYEERGRARKREMKREM